jgi:hypothetical protein
MYSLYIDFPEIQKYLETSDNEFVKKFMSEKTILWYDYLMTKLAGRFDRKGLWFALEEDISETMRDILSGFNSLTTKYHCDKCNLTEEYHLTFISVYIDSDDLDNLTNQIINNSFKTRNCKDEKCEQIMQLSSHFEDFVFINLIREGSNPEHNAFNNLTLNNFPMTIYLNNIDYHFQFLTHYIPPLSQFGHYTCICRTNDGLFQLTTCQRQTIFLNFCSNSHQSNSGCLFKIAKL